MKKKVLFFEGIFFLKETIDFKIKVLFWLNIKIFIYFPKKKFNFLAQNIIYLEKVLFSWRKY